MTAPAARSEGAHWSRTFFPIWTGQAFSIVGSQVAAFAVVWWLTQQTGSAKVLAGLAIASPATGVPRPVRQCVGRPLEPP
jgi:hypothetical protein